MVVIGDSGVGKSNLISRYTSGTFKEDNKETIGVGKGGENNQSIFLIQNIYKKES